MAKPAVYLETSVVGYATSGASRDLVVAGRQQITREWFALRATRCKLFISELVATEASGGDEDAAKERVAFLQGIPRLGSRTQQVNLQRTSSRAEPCPGRLRKMPCTLRSRRFME